MKTTAYMRGVAAAKAGLGIDCNPYNIDAPSGPEGNLFDQWFDGYLDTKFGTE